MRVVTAWKSDRAPIAAGHARSAASNGGMAASGHNEGRRAIVHAPRSGEAAACSARDEVDRIVATSIADVAVSQPRRTPAATRRLTVPRAERYCVPTQALERAARRQNTVRIRAWILAAAVASIGVGAGSRAMAQTRPDAATRTRARENFQSGVAAYQRGDYQVALEAFSTAYRLAPHPMVRANIANCYAQLHRPIEAVEWFEHFLAEATGAPETQRAEVTAHIRELRQQIAEVRLVIEPSDAPEVLATVDGHPVSPAELLRLEPGRHALVVRADGFRTERMDVDATGGSTRDVRVQLRSIAPAAPVAAAVAEPPPPQRAEPRQPVHVAAPPPSEATPQSVVTEPLAPMNVATPNGPVEPPSATNRLRPTVFYVAAGATGALAVGWIACGVAALVNNGAFETARRNIANGQGDLAQQQSQGGAAADAARGFALASDVFLVATLAGAAASAYVYTRTDFRAPSVTAVADQQGFQLFVSGRF